MKLILGNWCFHPGMLTTLITMLFMYLFISLGLWQLERAEYKKLLYAEFENRQSLEEVNFNLEKKHQLDIQELIWQKVKVNGIFLEQFQILLDNQVEDTRAGYYVYTPFILADSNQVVLVNRGWLLADADRAVVPELVSTYDVVSINGVIKDKPKTGLLLKELPPEKMGETTYRVQRIDFDELEKLINKKLLPYIIRLQPESEHGYVRKWRLPGSDESKHNGYAFQWFAFALVLTIIYLFLNIKKVK